MNSDKTLIDWNDKRISEIIDINPKRKLIKGINAKYVEMKGIDPFVRKITFFIIKKQIYICFFN